MAPVRVLPDKSKTTFYECHPIKEVRPVISIICGEGYHEEEFGKLENTKYIGELLVICPEHEDINLTSNIEEENLSAPARILITQFKLKKTKK